jgi:hypothetical protein
MARTTKQEIRLPADQARQFFLDHVRELPGVIKTEVRGDPTHSDPKFVISIPQGDLETEKRIYDLKLQTYQQFPEAQLDVWVEEAVASENRPPLGAETR